MRLLVTLTFVLFFGICVFGQENNIKELVAQGTELHDQGKYDEAIAKYKAALDIDINSTLANYELSYTCMVTQKYEDGIKYSKKVIEQNSNNQHEAYIVLGSCLDMLGKPDEAIKAYEEGLKKFPNSNLLNYNLALTSYNQKDYETAEKAAINAIIAKPAHGSSHIILAAIMKAKGQRVKSLMATYYFLMLEPNSKRSKINYNNLKNQLGQGVKKKDEKNINVNVPLNSTKDSEFGAAEMMVSLLAASQYVDKNKNKSDMELFAETTNKFFSVLGELKKENKGFWWDLYVTKFYDLVQTKNDEAFSYYISQSSDSDVVNKWIADNSNKIQEFKYWMMNKNKN
jgi:tetratricopeptide (TPR) repeat protein